MTTPLTRGSGSEMTKEQLLKSEMGQLIEIKTAPNNYKQAKNTINSRIGEDFEPDKPIQNYSNQDVKHNEQNQ